MCKTLTGFFSAILLLTMPAFAQDAPPSTSPTTEPSFPASYFHISIAGGNFVVDHLNLPERPPQQPGARASIASITNIGDLAVQIRGGPNGKLSQFRATRTVGDKTYRFLYGDGTMAFQQISDPNAAGPQQGVNLLQIIPTPTTGQVPDPSSIGITLRVTEILPAAGRQELVNLHAASFAELGAAHPEEVEQYLAPILANLHMEFLLGPSDVDMVQVFSDSMIDASTVARVNSLVATLDSDSSEIRQKASDQLTTLGPIAIVAMLRMDPASLSPQQSAAISALCPGAKLLTKDEIAAARQDPKFLCQCLVDGPRPVRAAALAALKQALGREVTLDLDGNPDDRMQALQAMGLPPTSRP